MLFTVEYKEDMFTWKCIKKKKKNTKETNFIQTYSIEFNEPLPIDMFIEVFFFIEDEIVLNFNVK